MNYSFLSRIRILSALVFFFALLLITKLFFVQVVHGSKWSEKADRQYSTPSENIFERGTIFFKGKDGGWIGGATTISGFKLAINPKEITDANTLYEKISSVVPLDKESFFTKAGKSSDP